MSKLAQPFHKISLPGKYGTNLVIFVYLFVFEVSLWLKFFLNYFTLKRATNVKLRRVLILTMQAKKALALFIIINELVSLAL